VDHRLYGQTHEKDSWGPRSLWPTSQFWVKQKGQRAAGKSGAGVAADERRLILIRELNDARWCAEKPAGGTCDFDRAIVFVEQQFFGAMKNGGLAEEGLQGAQELSVGARCKGRERRRGMADRECVPERPLVKAKSGRNHL
jgi:hypothetical protein